MSLFVLREGYRVVTTRSGARVVHVRTGGSIDLSPEDVLLFARATAGGVDAADPKLRNVIRRFVTLGVLVSAGGESSGDQEGVKSAPSDAGSPPPDTSSPLPELAAPRPPVIASSPTAAFAKPPPAPLSGGGAFSVPSEPARAPTLQAFSLTGLAPPAPSNKERAAENSSAVAAAGARPTGDEIARLMRADLKVRRREGSSLLDVTDPRSGKTFPLYDFELSLARMLDGRRLLREVVEAGQRLGIPVDLESLGQFVSQLDRYGFLSPPGAMPPEPAEGESTWAPRRKWDDGLRALFQSGLRMHRQGRYAEAANYFEAMLQQDPQNPEASEMLEQCRQRMTGGTSASSEPIPSPPDSGQVSLEQLFFGDEEPAADLPASLELPGPAPSSAPAVQSRTGVRSAERARPPEKPRRRWIILTAIGCSIVAVLGAGGYLAIKRDSAARPTNKPAKAERRPPEVAAADAGLHQLAASEADAGRAVPPRSAESSAGQLAQSPPDAGGQLATTSPSAVALASGSASPQANSRPGAGAVGGQRLEIAQQVAGPDAGILGSEQHREWIAAKVENRGRVTMAQVAAPASGVISWTAAPNQRVRRGETIGVVRNAKTSRERSLVAPKEGLLIPKVRDNEAVSFTQELAAIVYYEAYLQASLADARPQSTWSCEVYQADSNARADCKIIEVVRRGSKSFVTATTEPLWFDTAPDARVRVSPPQ